MAELTVSREGLGGVSGIASKAASSSGFAGWAKMVEGSSTLLGLLISEASV